MTYSQLKKQFRQAQNTRHLVKIILYIILISAIIICWFISAKRVRSLKENYAHQSENLIKELDVNFRKKLSQSQKNALELGVLGESMVDKGYSQYGILILEEAIKKDPTIRDLNLYTAKVYFDLEDYEKAKTTALCAKDLDPLYVPTYKLLTQIYLALGDDQNAEICYNKAKDFSEDK